MNHKDKAIYGLCKTAGANGILNLLNSSDPSKRDILENELIKVIELAVHIEASKHIDSSYTLDDL